MNAPMIEPRLLCLRHAAEQTPPLVLRRHVGGDRVRCQPDEGRRDALDDAGGHDAPHLIHDRKAEHGNHVAQQTQRQRTAAAPVDPARSRPVAGAAHSSARMPRRRGRSRPRLRRWPCRGWAGADPKMKNGSATSRIERRSTSIVRLDVALFTGCSEITDPLSVAATCHRAAHRRDAPECEARAADYTKE